MRSSTFGTRVRAFGVLLLAVVAGSAFGAGPEKASICRNVKSLREFKVVSEDVAADGAMRVVLSCPGGIFSFDVVLGEAKPTKVVFVVKDTRSWEGVSFQPGGKAEAVDLKA